MRVQTYFFAHKSTNPNKINHTTLYNIIDFISKPGLVSNRIDRNQLTRRQA